eukprot:8009969-Heterocapsa_arctica.AAC.1
MEKIEKNAKAKTAADDQQKKEAAEEAAKQKIQHTLRTANMTADWLGAGHPQLPQLTSDSVLKAGWASGEVNCNTPFVLNSSEVIAAALPADTLPRQTLVRWALEFPKQAAAKEHGIVQAP